jgi:hypothetical protein
MSATGYRSLACHTDPAKVPLLLSPLAGVGKSLGTAHTSAQCHLVFPLPDTCTDRGADAPVRSRPPGRLFA